MKYAIGQVFKLKQYSRLGIISNTFVFDDTFKILVYPLSTATYFAGSDDFILVCEDVMSEPMICETWNPLIINKKIIPKSCFVGTLQDDFMSLYKKYLYFRHMGLKSPELSIFTGPPIRANNDIRLEFRKQEFNLFAKLRQEEAEKLIS